MGIYLLSLSHKTTPLAVRALFAYTEREKLQVLEELLASGWIDEAVVLSTCNRMEIYCHGLGKEHPAGKILEIMESAAVRAAAGSKGRESSGTESETKNVLEAGDVLRFIRRYHGRQAVHHLFQVAAGLDSMVLGEDQILGQVKQAYEFSHERGYCRIYLNTLFRDAVTGAKKVKTDTEISRTSVSTASLAVKAAQEKLGGLKGKRMMIIGATGRIGNIILKNVQQISGLEIYVTMRTHSSLDKLGRGLRYETIAYEDRYLRMDEMDGYRERIRENIGYDLLLLERPYDAEEIDGYVELMAETCASRREYIRVNGEDVPIELVRKRFLKLDGEHIRYVMDSLRQNTTQVVNIRAYTLAALYNAPVTISQYYTAQVSHDMAQGFGGA